jgi:hypothetical protein
MLVPLRNRRPVRPTFLHWQDAGGSSQPLQTRPFALSRALALRPIRSAAPSLRGRLQRTCLFAWQVSSPHLLADLLRTSRPIQRPVAALRVAQSHASRPPLGGPRTPIRS